MNELGLSLLFFQFIFLIVDLSVSSVHVKQAADSLLNGRVIAVPTDTIYGVAGLAQNTDAVRKIYEIKKRSLTNPIAISVGAVCDIHK